MAPRRRGLGPEGPDDYAAGDMQETRGPGMHLFLSIGEAMVELSRAEGDLWRLGFAGDTLNTAWYARAALPAGWEVSYLTRLGNDPFSPRMLDFLAANRIGTGFIARDARRSVGLYAIELHEGERSFAYWRGQSAARGLADDPAVLDRAFAAATAVYLSGITLAILPAPARAALIERLALARAAGKVTAFDPNIRPALWDSPEAMRATLMQAARGAGIVLPSYDDEAAQFGDADMAACAARWMAAGAGEVVVKNGGGPMLLRDGAGERLVEVARAAPVDSTGAGDSFNGAYLAARLAGRDMAAAARAGHAMSLRVIARPGALIPMADLSG